MTGEIKNPVKRRETPVHVHRDMRVMDIVTLCPESAAIMAEYGLHCFSCSVGGMETLTEGCTMHGFDDETIDALVVDLNDAIAAMPVRPGTLVITLPAAEAVAALARQEGKTDNVILSVLVDAQGGFCMEFKDEPAEDDAVFFHADAPHVRIVADPVTLWRIGGSTIDYRDDRFKLDLADGPSPGGACACKSGGTCGCS